MVYPRKSKTETGWKVERYSDMNRLLSVRYFNDEIKATRYRNKVMKED